MPFFPAIKDHLQSAVRPGRRGEQPQPASLLNAMVGGLAVAAPLLFAAGGGRLSFGLAIALGTLSVSRVSRAQSLTSRLQAPFSAFIAATMSLLVATLLSGHGVASDFAAVLVASSSTLLIRFSREVAVGAIRFMLFLIIFGNAIDAATAPFAVATAIFIGVSWTALLVVVIELCAAPSAATDATPAIPQQNTQSTCNRLRRMRRELHSLAQWDYPFRLALGLSLSLALKTIFPAHHFGWVTVTVALLTPRQFEAWPIRATQRTLGTLGGVIAAGFTFALNIPTGLLIALLIVLGALRKWFEERNYLAYSAVMAPLVLLLLSANHAASYELLNDRVLATLLGVALVLLSNLLAAHSTARAARLAAVRP